MSNGCMASACATSAPLVAAPSACPSKKTSAAWFQRRRRTVSCRASGGRADHDGLWLPRRDMMLSGLSGVAAGLALYPGVASGATCTKPDPVDEKVVQCTDPAGALPCPLVSPADPVDFTPETKVKRFRKPVHLLTREEQEKYKEAVAKMKALPDEHPLSFKAQAAIHEAYCDAHYKYESTDKNGPFDVHFSWLFAPWHRMYIYFYERALGQLIGDETFALPYWNWDTPEGMVVPAIFKDSVGNPLYDANRNQTTLDALIDLEYLSHRDDPLIPFKGPKDQKYMELVDRNLSSIFTQQVRSGTSAESYLGEKFCTAGGGMGSLERMAHTNVHVWVGKPGVPAGTTCSAENGGVPNHTAGGFSCNNDMGFLGSAGRDPIFYSHHSNVDRMWFLWSTRLGGGDGFDDDDWRDASFVFYDNVENPRKVRIKFSDVLDTHNLGYTYHPKFNRDLPWLKRRITSLVPHGKDAPSTPSTRKAPAAFPLELKKGQVVEVPGLGVPAKEPGKELLLLIDGIMFDPQAPNKFDVAINVPADKAVHVGPQHKEYVGAFAVVPGSGAGKLRQEKISFCINDALFDIEADDAKTVDVVIVPRTESKIKLNVRPTIQYRN